MKKILLVAIIGLCLCACSKSSEEIETGKIGCEQKNTVIEEDGAVLIDVRTKEEYNEGHLDNAINIPYDVIVSNIKEDKDTPIVVYCKSGARSAKAAKSLEDAGFTKVYDLGAMSNC